MRVFKMFKQAVGIIMIAVIFSSCAAKIAEKNIEEYDEVKSDSLDALDIVYQSDEKSFLVKSKPIVVNKDIYKVKTYAILGAGYNPKQDTSKLNNFYKALLAEGDRVFGDGFVVLKTSSKKVPIYPVRTGINGRWAILNGYEPIDYKKHKNILRSMDEIVSDFNASDSILSFNMIGSSYGSVVAAHTAMAIIDEDNGIDHIDVLALSASMIHPESELAYTLMDYVRQEKIDRIFYQVNPEDNVMGASGSTYKEAVRGYRSVLYSKPSIINMKYHPHNIASTNRERAYEIFNMILLDYQQEYGLDDPM